MSEASQKRARGADAIDLTTEDLSPREKKMRESINGVAAELLCPITQELPFDPVMAKDGKIYERTAILEWFRKKDGDATSPSTGKVIGTELLPAVQTKNTIEMLVKSGAIVGEIAEAWKEKLADEKEVKEMRTKAEGCDGLAMWTLGVWYQNGMKGLAKDLAQARAWYGRSAAVRYPRGTASFGHFLLDGLGGPQDDVFGVMNVTAAAELGSDVGAYFLGYAFFRGAYGLPKDHVRARYWLKKVADSECEHKHLHPDNITEAVEWLRELQDE